MSSLKKNIVLDIDATLVHTHGDVDDFETLKVFSDSTKARLRRRLYSMKLIDVASLTGYGVVSVLSGIYRPYLREFLDFCFKYFDNVIIWSAGKKKYVEKMCQIMFPLKNQQPLVIYTYDDCDVGEEDYLKKPLTKIYNDPRTNGMLNEKNTFILDDRDDTFSLNHHNGIQIPEFESDMSVEDITKHPDDNLLKVMAWLSQRRVKNHKDVRKLGKKNIFKTSVKEYKDMLKKENYKP